MNPRQSLHERICEIRVWGVPDDHEQRNLMPINSVQFIWLIPDAAVVRQGDPSTLPDRFKPRLVGTIMREVISVPFDG